MSTRAHPAVAARRRAVVRARGRRRRTILLAAVVGLAAVAGTWWLLTGPLLALRSVEISGYERTDAAALEDALRQTARRGTIFDLPTRELRMVAGAFPWVESISVHPDLPLGARIEVTSAVPVAVAVTKGDTLLVSASGRALGPAPGGTGLPRLRALDGPLAVGDRLTGAPRAALRFVAATDPGTATRLRAVRVANGVLTARLRSPAGPDLLLGAPTALVTKARSLDAVLAHLSPGEEAVAEYIDLSVPERPAVGGLPAE